jgi:hypothetical protein
MVDQIDEPIETPLACEDTIEYDNRIEDDFETEPEETQDDVYSHKNWEEIEHQFARYERNYRVRRIRELTMAPLKKRGRRGLRRRVAA